jgi:hypothetical protein
MIRVTIIGLHLMTRLKMIKLAGVRYGLCEGIADVLSDEAPALRVPALHSRLSSRDRTCR